MTRKEDAAPPGSNYSAVNCDRPRLLDLLLNISRRLLAGARKTLMSLDFMERKGLLVPPNNLYFHLFSVVTALLCDVFDQYKRSSVTKLPDKLFPPLHKG